MKINFLFMIPILLATCSCSLDNSGSIPNEKQLGFNTDACEDNDDEEKSSSCKAALLAANTMYKNSELEDEKEKR